MRRDSCVCARARVLVHLRVSLCHVRPSVRPSVLACAGVRARRRARARGFRWPRGERTNGRADERAVADGVNRQSSDSAHTTRHCIALPSPEGVGLGDPMHNSAICAAQLRTEVDVRAAVGVQCAQPAQRRSSPARRVHLRCGRRSSSAARSVPAQTWPVSVCVVPAQTWPVSVCVVPAQTWPVSGFLISERALPASATYPVGHPVAWGALNLPPLDLRAVDAASHAAYLPRIGGRPGRKGLLCGEKVG